MPAMTDIRRLDSVELPVQVDRYPVARYSLVEARPLDGVGANSPPLIPPWLPDHWRRQARQKCPQPLFCRAAGRTEATLGRDLFSV